MGKAFRRGRRMDVTYVPFYRLVLDKLGWGRWLTGWSRGTRSSP